LADSKVTTNHEEIRQWVEEHDGRPAAVPGHTDRGSSRAVKIYFPDQYLSDPIEEISWDEFFNQFEEKDLAFMYQDDEDSRFFRIVERY
jgi:hypothetical protein